MDFIEEKLWQELKNIPENGIDTFTLTNLN